MVHIGIQSKTGISMLRIYLPLKNQVSGLRIYRIISISNVKIENLEYHVVYGRIWIYHVKHLEICLDISCICRTCPMIFTGMPFDTDVCAHAKVLSRCTERFWHDTWYMGLILKLGVLCPTHMYIYIYRSEHVSLATHNGSETSSVLHPVVRCGRSKMIHFFVLWNSQMNTYYVHTPRVKYGLVFTNEAAVLEVPCMYTHALTTSSPNSRSTSGPRPQISDCSGAEPPRCVSIVTYACGTSSDPTSNILVVPNKVVTFCRVYLFCVRVSYAHQ